MAVHQAAKDYSQRDHRKALGYDRVIKGHLAALLRDTFKLLAFYSVGLDIRVCLLYFPGALKLFYFIILLANLRSITIKTFLIYKTSLALRLPLVRFLQAGG